jgi:hypothetical protein
MYGLIHCALRDFVTATQGEQFWESILVSANIEPDMFLSMRSYEDSITMALVAATAENMNREVDELLELFGHYWLTVFAPTSYGSLLDLAGNEPFEFLQNLNNLHERISASFIDFRPPVFEISIINANCREFHYYSSRKGLTPFVTGILRGLPTIFNTNTNIEKKKTLEWGEGEHSIYLITIVAPTVEDHA